MGMNQENIKFFCPDPLVEFDFGELDLVNWILDTIMKFQNQILHIRNSKRKWFTLAYSLLSYKYGDIRDLVLNSS